MPHVGSFAICAPFGDAVYPRALAFLRRARISARSLHRGAASLHRRNRLFTNIRSINLPRPTETRPTRGLNSGTPANGLAGDGVKAFGSWTRLIVLITPLNFMTSGEVRAEQPAGFGRAPPTGSPRGFRFQHGCSVSRCSRAGAIFTAKPTDFSRPAISCWIEIEIKTI